MALDKYFEFQEDMIVSVIDPSISYCALDRKQSNFAIRGYSRLLGIHVPDEIILLFFVYYFESMPSSYVTGFGEINYEKSQICRRCINKPDKSHWVSQIGWQTGKYSFKVRMKTLPAGGIVIGIVTNPKGFIKIADSLNNWAFDLERSGLTYQLYYLDVRSARKKRAKWHFDGLFHFDHGIEQFNKKQKIVWKNGDVIEFIIDCDEWELQINFNDQRIETLDVEKHQKYYPAIAFGGKNSAAELQVLSCE